MGGGTLKQTPQRVQDPASDFTEHGRQPGSSSLAFLSAPQSGPPADPADELLSLTGQLPAASPANGGPANGGAHAPGPLRFLGGKVGMAPEDVDGAYTAASKGVRGVMSLNKGRKAISEAHAVGALGPAAGQIAGWGQSAVSGAGQALAAGGRGLRNGLSTVGPALGQAWDGLGGVAQKGAGMLRQAPALAGKAMNAASDGVDTLKYLAHLAQNDPAGLVEHTKFLGGKALAGLQDGATALGGKATSALGKAGDGLQDLASTALTKGKGALSSGGDLVSGAAKWTKNKGGEALANMAADSKVPTGMEKLGGRIGMLGGAAQAFGGLTDMKDGKVVEGGLKTGSGVANAASGYMMTVGKVGAGKMLGGAGAVLEGGMDMYSGWKNKDKEKMGVGAAKSVSGGLMMAGAATANPVLFAAGAIGYGGAVLYENRDVIAKYGGKAVTAIKTGAVDGAKWAGEKASQGWDAAKATAGKTGEALKEGASWAGNKVSNGASALKDGAKKIGGWLGL